MGETLRGPHVLFALQVLYPLVQTGSLGRELVEWVKRRDTMSFSEKRDGYRELADRVLRRSEHLQYASWEILARDEDPEGAYWGWIDGTAQDAIDEAEQEHDDHSFYGFVTILLLVPEHTETGRILLTQEDDLEEDEDGVPAQLLEHFLRLPQSIDFRDVTSDVVMVRPGRGGRGVTESLLGDGTYHHLGPVL